MCNICYCAYLVKIQPSTSKCHVTRCMARFNDDNAIHGNSMNTCEIGPAAIPKPVRQPDAAQPLSALISLPVPSLKSLSLSVAVLERFYCSHVTLHCDRELWPRDLDLWPWTFLVCRVCRSETVRKLSSIGQSAAELLQFELWPYEHEDVPRVALCSEIL